MWIGGYSDWTPAEQREWDRDLEENERLYEERQKRQEQELNAIKAESKTWKEWALFNPLYHAFIRVGGNRKGKTLPYEVCLLENSPVRRDVERDLLFEIGNVIYPQVDSTLQYDLPKGTSQIKFQVSSRQYKDVEYICYCTPETWSYTVMNEILEGLNEQLIPPQDLTEGLFMTLSFVKRK